MKPSSAPISDTENLDKLSGIVKRVTYHSVETGYSVLKVNPFNKPNEEISVTVHQSKVFAGATMDFYGTWTHHPSYGQQFKAIRTSERKPATAHALEKYLGSGLIKGVGPVTASRIVKHFGTETMDVFEHHIERLTEVTGIAQLKLQSIQKAWIEHQEIRNVMLFLQSHNISTLFAVKIYKTYGNDAIQIVSDNPYRLAQDIYGIGFFSADKIALSLGLATDSPQRIRAGIDHALQSAREEGHCYLTKPQILGEVRELLQLQDEEAITRNLEVMEKADELKTRQLLDANLDLQTAYYAHSLFYDENYIATRIKALVEYRIRAHPEKLKQPLDAFCLAQGIRLSEEQEASVLRMATERISILTGGPGCGKTTTTRALVGLLRSMNKSILLAAPTGRAAQRMSEVISTGDEKLESKTIHRLLEYDPASGGFKRNEESPLDTDFLIVDECSMLDVHLAASVLRSVPRHAQLVLIGDADQLPSVGAGNVLKDIIESGSVPCMRLTKVFRQAQESLIIQYAHAINQGEIPKIDSPFRHPDLWTKQSDCLFIDSEEATQEQLRFISKVKKASAYPTMEESTGTAEEEAALYATGTSAQIPAKFSHVDVERLLEARTHSEELKEVLKRVHPWSSLRYGLSAVDMVRRLYAQVIPRYFGKEEEIQVLCPMTRGTLGTQNLNQVIQEAINPAKPGKAQLSLAGRIFRVGDRVIQKRNNYDLSVFNGDIGRIVDLDNEEMTAIVAFRNGSETREVIYERESLPEMDLAYAITIHKSQGSEFGVIIIPLVSQHFQMLFRNLIYTGLTRAKKLAVFVGTRTALQLAVSKQNTAIRQTALKFLLTHS
jgi:exodeoxyribonuclease V alpha subunit